MRRSARPPSRALAAITVVLMVAVVGADLWVITSFNRATAVGADEALDRYRQSVATNATTLGPVAGGSKSSAVTSVVTDPLPTSTIEPTGSSAPATSKPPVSEPSTPSTTAAISELRPEPGVYLYTTDGHEQLGSSRHDYPSTTPAIVERGTGCNWTFDHQVLKEHTDRYTTCSEADRFSLTRWILHREFFGVSMDEDYTCTGSPLSESGRSGGETIDVSCRAEDEDRIELALEYVGREAMSVGGASIEAVHVRGEGTLSGNPDGRASLDLWLDSRTGLRLREIRSLEASVTALGAESPYRERVEFVLQSITPRR